ncbi:CH1B2 protein, partial [Crocuta crocuta]
MLNMEKHLFNLKFSVEELNRNVKNMIKKERLRDAWSKKKKSIQECNTNVSRTYTENEIRQKNQAINLYGRSARVDAVGARIQTAGTKGKRTEAVAIAVKCMDATLRGMNL